MSAVKGTIKSTDEITVFFTRAKRIQKDSFTALVQTQDGKRGLTGRVAYVAGKRLGNAPLRSRAKRRLREAARLCQVPWAGFDVVFVAKRNTTTSSFESTLKDMRALQKELTEAQEQGER